ncbi:exopolysaccharide biosynthesis polyprenyl glycosylphosphotransferase [Solirubrobacter sp. CPCC 204708]|uniref:Exopolysaccharide biosynthesis polyprenyl glycosylphosphotransferase n=1 Tax=Solirubrobacter deserti TaxID=2282478 RepID=A0ABT4RUG6_9ACTN|nr:exopolysaccharide biosynthesis polyprenyl glycosylphosphotransferase [Solirubrobacter deserti]MBE2314493.1 exopolysaccharide biosynthesis polyprenyl glycosylphosphotransferase [Solirubrobacter deserti]MDA0142100.1 exopolysaccharide biosynthesis polyprenyl glycosylphosphotransferase [Solirubrobacter deserti]
MQTREHSSAATPGRGRFLRPAAAGNVPLVIESSAPAGVRYRDRIFRRSLLIADVAGALLVVGAAEALVGHRTAAFALPLIVPCVSTAAGLYRRDESVLASNTLDEAPAVFQAATLSAVLTFLIASLGSSLDASYVALTMVGLTALMLLLRAVARSAARRFTQSERCLVVGEPDAAKRLASRLRTAPAVKAEVVGCRPLTPDGLRQHVLEARAQRVVIAGDNAADEHVHETIQVAKALGVKVSLLPRTFDVVGSAVDFDYLGGVTLLGVRRVALSKRAQRVKRALDVIGAGCALALLAPLMLAVALAIKLDSPGPVLFRQERVGRDGRRFQIFKFRSMVADAEARKAELRALNEADGLFKIDRDPRITRVGGVLRRSCLDELPQLINVLRGEMSLVGPRPLITEEDQMIQGWHRRRLELTPGVTGPWQVLGAARIPLHEMVAIDYLYVANWSLWGDVKVLLRTVPCVLARRGQ